MNFIEELKVTHKKIYCLGLEEGSGMCPETSGI